MKNIDENRFEESIEQVWRHRKAPKTAWFAEEVGFSQRRRARTIIKNVAWHHSRSTDESSQGWNVLECGRPSHSNDVYVAMRPQLCAR